MSTSNTYSPHLQFPWLHSLVPWCLGVLCLVSNWSCLRNGLSFPSWLRCHHESQMLSEEHANLFPIWFLSALSGVTKQETWRAACRGVMTMDSYPAGGGTNWTNTGIVWQEYRRGHWARSAFQILLCAHNFMGGFMIFAICFMSHWGSCDELQRNVCRFLHVAWAPCFWCFLMCQAAVLWESISHNLLVPFSKMIF